MKILTVPSPSQDIQELTQDAVGFPYQRIAGPHDRIRIAFHAVHHGPDRGREITVIAPTEVPGSGGNKGVNGDGKGNRDNR